MFTRIAPQTGIPDKEQVEREEMCPPHAFDQGWGLGAGEEIHSDTVPVLFCAACGEVRLLRVPTDAV
jgi:hypothetical protein